MAIKSSSCWIKEKFFQVISLSLLSQGNRRIYSEYSQNASNNVTIQSVIVMNIFLFISITLKNKEKPGWGRHDNPSLHIQSSGAIHNFKKQTVLDNDRFEQHVKFSQKVKTHVYNIMLTSSKDVTSGKGNRNRTRWERSLVGTVWGFSHDSSYCLALDYLFPIFSFIICVSLAIPQNLAIL